MLSFMKKTKTLVDFFKIVIIVLNDSRTKKLNSTYYEKKLLLA